MNWNYVFNYQGIFGFTFFIGVVLLAIIFAI